MRIFLSGHSLIDQPILDQMAEIATSLGKQLDWNRQFLVGSSISARTRGEGVGNDKWPGYQTGLNRSGADPEIIGELRKSITTPGHRYDALLITEQHGLLGSLTWHETVRFLRHYHDRLIDGNPQATTYLYEPWLGLNDKGDPRAAGLRMKDRLLQFGNVSQLA